MQNNPAYGTHRDIVDPAQYEVSFRQPGCLVQTRGFASRPLDRFAFIEDRMK